MEIKHLKVFTSIADGQSMASVAETLGITKSAISHIVQNIEKEVGAELFIRSKSMELTEMGSMFVHTAKKIIATYEDGIERMHCLSGGLYGDLHIGVGSFIEPVIRKAVARLLKDNPLLRVDAHVYRSNTLNHLLKAGKLDVAFTLNTAYDDEGIVSIPCIPIKIVAVMSRTHDLAKKEKVTFEEICKYDCIMPSENRRAFATINKYIDKDLSKLRNRITINTADGALNMVEEENYITFMTIQHIINRPKLVAKPIVGLEMELKSNMHYLQDVHVKKSALELKKILKEYAVPISKMMEL